MFTKKPDKDSIDNVSGYRENKQRTVSHAYDRHVEKSRVRTEKNHYLDVNSDIKYSKKREREQHSFYEYNEETKKQKISYSNYNDVSNLTVELKYHGKAKEDTLSYQDKIKTEEYIPTDYQERLKIINDVYTKRRGDPQILEIFCGNCKSPTMIYQKDGPGRLLRCYLDRIHFPEHLQKRQFEDFKETKTPKLECEKCDSIIGVPMTYEPEDRAAYRMLKGKSFFKKR